VNAEKEYATLGVGAESASDVFETTGAGVTFLDGSMVNCGSLVSALNLVYSKGYTHHEKQLNDNGDNYWNRVEVTFSRREHSVTSARSDILIPSEEELCQRRESNCTKEFAMIVTSADVYGDETAYVKDDRPERESEHDVRAIDIHVRSWLAKERFVTHEMGLEDIFRVYVKLVCKESYLRCQIFSRVASLPEQG